VAFANSIGISQSALSKMCSGAIFPALQTAIEIERITGGAVPVSSWSSDTDTPQAKAS
jgi:DNA-binding transcriptional regulator YdaS (Cro superfamily)